MRKQLRFAAAVAGVVAFAAGSARADIVFGFEDQTATTPNGGYTTLTETVAGLTLTLSRQGGTRFDIFDDSSFPGSFPAVWGTRSLDPFFDSGSSAFVANFSSAVSSFALSYGDFGADSDTATILAYSGPDGTGTLLASNSDVYGFNTLPGQFDTFGVTADGIQSVVFIGGSPAFPNSVYYDNLDVTVGAVAAPEPASLTLLALGVPGVTALIRRRRVVA